MNATTATKPKRQTEIVTLTNSFHNTEVRVRLQKGAFLDSLTKSQERRVWAKLCGSNDCTCGVVR